MVSVVVGARNDERTIAACLESIGRLRHPNFEVIVIDDASSDRSIEIASTVPGIRLLRQPSRGRFRTLYAAAVHAARGSLIAFTRGDCVVDSDWLTLAVQALTEDHCDAVGGLVLPSKDERGVPARVRSSIGKAGAMRSSRDRVAQLCDRNMLVRKSSLISVGGVNECFVEKSDGRDLATRLLAADMAIGWCPAGFVWCSGHRTLSEFLHQRIREGCAAAGIAIASISGIAQALARRPYAVATGGAAIVPTAGVGRGSARSRTIGNSRSPAAYPSGR
jgi:glycosyltransferase involved in cell wall biosynthesis